MSVAWNKHTQTQYSWFVRLYLCGYLLSLLDGWAFLAQKKNWSGFQTAVIYFLVQRTLNWGKTGEKGSSSQPTMQAHDGISTEIFQRQVPLKMGGYACFDTPVIPLLGVMSCLFLWGHQLGGMSNCFDWYKMWESCPEKPVCPCLDVKACRTHKSLILISITRCRLLIPIGTCLSLQKEKLLHWSFPILWYCWLLLHSDTYFPDRVATSHIWRG